jgi:hypothetical protein
MGLIALTSAPRWRGRGGGGIVSQTAKGGREGSGSNLQQQLRDVAVVVLACDVQGGAAADEGGGGEGDEGGGGRVMGGVGRCTWGAVRWEEHRGRGVRTLDRSCL